MKTVLITGQGRVMVFTVRAAAVLYQQIWGGVLITEQLYADIYSELLVDTAE